MLGHHWPMTFLPLFLVFSSQCRSAHIMQNSVWPLSRNYDSVSIRLSLISFETVVPFLSSHLLLHHFLLLFPQLFQCPPPLLSSPHPTSSPVPLPSSVFLLHSYSLIFISSSYPLFLSSSTSSISVVVCIKRFENMNLGLEIFCVWVFDKNDVCCHLY